MYRNWCAGRGLPDGAGASPAEFTVEQVMEAIGYWKDKCLVQP